MRLTITMLKPFWSDGNYLIILNITIAMAQSYSIILKLAFRSGNNTLSALQKM